MIRWGIISTAKIGREQVIPAIQQSSNGRVVAVGSRDADKAREFAAELGIERAYGSYADLIADPEIDAIYNPLPNDGHMPWTIGALKAGKHVLCEKPFAMNAAETVEMIAAAKEAGKHLMEAFMWRYHPQHARVKALVDAGEIGVPLTIHAQFTFALPWDNTSNVRLTPEMGGGGLLDVGGYCVTSTRYHARQEPDRVSGFMTLGKNSGVDENFVGILHYPNGMLAHFDCGMRGTFRNSYTIVGDQGTVTVRAAFRPDDNPGLIDLARVGQPVETVSVPPANQYILMVEDFADAVLNNRPTLYSAEDGLQNMKLLDALKQSALEGRAVEV